MNETGICFIFMYPFMCIEWKEKCERMYAETVYKCSFNTLHCFCFMMTLSIVLHTVLNILYVPEWLM